MGKISTLKIDKFDKETLKEKITAYFVECDAKKEVYTISGLAFSLRVPKDDIKKYPENSRFTDLLTHTKQKCENQLIQMLLKKQIDKTVVNLLLINDFGFKNHVSKTEDKETKKIADVKKTISDVLNDLANG